jgi:hypothetical protein
LYDLPGWLLCLLLVALCSGGAALGVLATRTAADRLFGPSPGHNEVVSFYMEAFGVFYGLTLGLIAVATWQNYTEVDKLVAQEAAALRVLHGNMSWYPPAVRGELNRGLLAYTDFVIREEWPTQRQGILLGTGQEQLLAFRRPLMAFDPATERRRLCRECKRTPPSWRSSA